MEIITLFEKTPKELPYKNRGNNAEFLFGIVVYGVGVTPNNKPYNVGADVGNVQVKSYRATICSGLDIVNHINNDFATRYAYVTKDLTTAYVMNKNEYLTFVENFSTIDRDSKKNGGGLKLRLKCESKKMRAWLDTNI